MAVPDLSGDALAGWASCSESTSCDAVAHDVIVFDDDVWPFNDAVNTLALTTVTFGVDDGRIFEAYTEVNSAQKQLTIAEPPPPGSPAYDLRAILTHEAGHFLGIAHATSTSAVMYAYYQPAAIDLTPDDVAAICTVYPPQFPGSPAGCGCSGVGNGPATGALGVGVSLAALLRLRRRRA
jgi:MYXO-CTERM domain-containing protein